MLAPNGDLITANGDAVNGDPTQPSELVEFTSGGKFVGQFSLDPGQGGAFGLAVTNAGGLLRLAAVDDNPNVDNASSLDVWTFQTSGKFSALLGNIPVLGSLALGTDLTSTGNGWPSQVVTSAGPLALPGSPSSRSWWRWWV